MKSCRWKHTQKKKERDIVEEKNVFHDVERFTFFWYIFFALCKAVFYVHKLISILFEHSFGNVIELKVV